jgi:CRISPR/Cas system-associated exonuclease Cas4 (RecB family)
MNTESKQVDHTDRAHAEFGPSSLKYVAKCAGYHGKEGTSAAAEKGTRIHEALEVRDPSALHDEEEVGMYEDIIREEDQLIATVLGDKTYITYREIRLTVELDCDTPTFGTCDLFLNAGEEALMIDYKTGVSKIDPPDENWQAKAYALAAFQKFPDVSRIVFAFIAPLREEDLVGTFHREDVPSLHKEISDVIKRAEKTRPLWEKNNGADIDIDTLAPSVNCRFCRHESNCPALGAVCIDVAKRYRPDLLPDGPIASHDIDDPEALEKLFVVAKICEEWASGIKNKTTKLALEGQEFETLKLRSMGSLKKTVEKNYLAQLAVRHGLDLTEVIEAADLTLNQLCKALNDKMPRGQKKAAVERFSAEAIDLNLVDIGPTRYTLTSK